jgi:CheY-like chemotaxis protein
MAELQAYAPGSSAAGASAAAEPQREILVIDDDELIQKSVTDVLREEGYIVHAASDAHDALVLLKDLRPSLILLDVDIPGINGLELLRKLKAGALTANIPVFMLSGHNRREVVMEAYREGAVEFIAKPFKRELLMQKLEAALERSRHTEGVAGT